MAKPIVKWVGGKVKLVPKLLELLPPDADKLRHVEPFAGGASLFFAREPAKAVLADTNSELIATYAAVRDEVWEVVKHLRQHQQQHGQVHYYSTRERFNKKQDSLAWRAAAIIYINHTCFNGLWRVNKAGNFNVPFGDYKNPMILDEPRLREASELLQRDRTVLHPCDFGDVAQIVGPDDFVYLDPPYAPVETQATPIFEGYTPGGFGYDEHVRLREAFSLMDSRGAKLMLSNSYTQFVCDLYRKWNITKVTALRSVSRDGAGRKDVVEAVIRNY